MEKCTQEMTSRRTCNKTWSRRSPKKNTRWNIIKRKQIQIFSNPKTLINVWIRLKYIFSSAASNYTSCQIVNSNLSFLNKPQVLSRRELAIIYHRLKCKELPTNYTQQSCSYMDKHLIQTRKCLIHRLPKCAEVSP